MQTARESNHNIRPLLVTDVSHCRSTIINLFRVPLNLVTVVVLLCIKRGLLASKLVIFSTTSALALTAALAARSLDTNTRTGQKSE